MSRFCVIAGTKISLTNGNSLPIEQIKAGEEVLSFDLNTLQRSQKYDVLVKLKTNDFSGIIKKDYVKNIWKNTAEEYFAINDRLKITGDHIVLAKRDNTYYWTKVFNLKIGDYLFTEFNAFEKIETMILIKEKVKVFNLEVNSIYNYFANSYLIHNGAPCSACVACGTLHTIFAFSKDYTSYAADASDSTSNQKAGDAINWHTFQDAIDTDATGSNISTSSNYNNNYEANSRSSFGVYKNDPDSFFGTTNTYSYVCALQKRYIAYTARLLLPFFNTTDNIKVYFRIDNRGGTSSHAVGIGIVHKPVMIGTDGSNSAMSVKHNAVASSPAIPSVQNPNQFLWISDSLKQYYETGNSGDITNAAETFKTQYSMDFNAIFNESRIGLRVDGVNSMGESGTATAEEHLVEPNKATHGTAQPGGHGTGATRLIATTRTGATGAGGLNSSTLDNNGDIIGLEITDGVTSNTIGKKVITFSYKLASSTVPNPNSKVVAARYIVPSTIRSNNNPASGGTDTDFTDSNGDFELRHLDSLSITDGAWAVYVFDSTSNENYVKFTIVDDPG